MLHLLQIVFMIFMKATFDKIVRSQGVNPHYILLNEVYTKQGTDVKQFVELRRASNYERVSLNGYSLLVAETTANKNIKVGFLKVYHFI